MDDETIATVDEYRLQFWDWLSEYVLTLPMAVELGLVALSLFVATLFTRAVRTQIAKGGFTEPGPGRYARIAMVLRTVDAFLFPLSAIVVLFTADQLSTYAGYDAGLCRIVLKLLVAWVVIRLMTRVIRNEFARNFAGFIIWAIAALSIFGILDQVTASLGEAGVSFGDFKITALGVIKGLLVLAGLLYGSTILANFIDGRLGSTKLNTASQVLIGKIVRIFLIATALLIAITAAGIDLSVLAVFTGGIGLGIGFGLQRGFSNMFSGMMLLIDQSIKPGDVIEITDPTGGQTTFGWVTHMGGRYTEIVTRDNKSYLIPNEHLITQQVVNWSHGNTLVRLKVDFGVHYKSDPHFVKKIAQEAATTVDRVQEDPKPMCHLVGFGDSSLDFSLRFWIRDAEKGVTNVQGDVMLALWDAFKEHGIEIPYPHREVFLHEEKKEKTA